MVKYFIIYLIIWSQVIILMFLFFFTFIIFNLFFFSFITIYVDSLTDSKLPSIH